jgi:predicted xylose isomerase-like sugar epimerase
MFWRIAMGAKERLQNVQSVLEKRGVRDVKFCFAPGAASKMPLSDFQNSVADFFDAYLKERFVVVPRVGDAPIAA